MTLVEVLRRTLFPIQGVQKIIPKKQLLQSSLCQKRPMPTQVARGQPLRPCSFTDPLNLTTNTAQDKKSTISLGTSACCMRGMTGVQARR